MGTEESTLKKNGYELEKETENAVVATKGDDKFIIKKILLKQTPRELISEIEVYKTTNHPHIVNSKNSFKDENVYYVVMDYCQGGNLATKIRESVDKKQPSEESQVLSWIVEICMALKTSHDKGLLHKHLTPENVYFTEFGTVCLGEFGKIHENSKNTKSNRLKTINYLAPEVFTQGTYDAKSDIWSVGCILYELCTQTSAFTAETPVKLMPKVIGGPYPSIPDTFSPELRELLKDILEKDPQSRPTASEILEHPVVLSCLIEKCKTTVKELQEKLKQLRDLADGLESVHTNTTIGSLTGGVIGAAGGITAIVGLILSPFTLGASLIVTGVGIGVSTLGGVTAGASNIRNLVKSSSDRKAVRTIIKEFEEKMKAVITWIKQINESLQAIRSRFESADLSTEHTEFSPENLVRLGSRAGRGLGGIAELVRLVQVVNVGKIVAQTSRAIRVAEVATGVFSGLFLAVDLFFIAMDAKEIHHIRQAKAAERRGEASSESVSETETPSDQASLVPSSPMQESEESETQDQSSQNTTPIRSELMKFVRSIREAADNLQKVLDDFKSVISSIPSLQNEREHGWRDMELM
uniref:non-specific serine/threonine protein kinase n=1 Tax=Dicentrarchus labrax TaxID=13489 RepID=A0A8C4DU78_DICLA